MPTTDQKRKILAFLLADGWTDLNKADRFDELLNGIVGLKDQSPEEIEGQWDELDHEALADEIKEACLFLAFEDWISD